MRSTRSLDLVHAICESELSHLSYTNSKRTALPCYTFQKEKKSYLEEEKGAKPRKKPPDPDSFICWRKKSWGRMPSGPHIYADGSFRLFQKIIIFFDFYLEINKKSTIFAVQKKRNSKKKLYVLNLN